VATDVLTLICIYLLSVLLTAFFTGSFSHKLHPQALCPNWPFAEG